MRQVRICRSDHIQHLRQELVAFNEWAEATPDRLVEFKIIADTGNDLFGPQTHWIESRVLERGRAQPDQAVWQLVTDSLRAWVEGDMSRHVSYYTEGAALITPTGSCHKGRGGLRRIYESTWAEMPGLALKIRSGDIYYPASNVAVVTLHGRFRHDLVAEFMQWSSLQTQVFEGGRWQIAAMQVFNESGRRLAFAEQSC